MILQAKIMAIATHIAKNSFKYALIGIALWFLFGKLEGWWSNYKQEQQDLGAYEQSDRENKETIEKKDEEIKKLQEQLDIERAANARNTAKIAEVQNENDEFRERLMRHDIDAIIARRGEEVVERAYTRGTNTYFGMWDDKTRELEHYGINRGNGLPGSIVPTTPSINKDEGNRKN